MWFLLWCEDDTSYSLVKNTAVFYEEPVSVGESVKFVYDNQECLGIIKGMDEDYETLKIRQDELNASNKKKAASFHEDQPRTAAKEFRAKMSNIVSALKPRKGKASKGHGKTTSKKRMRGSSLDQEPTLPSASNNSLEKRNRGKGIYTSDSDDELTAEEQALLDKIQKKKRKQDSRRELRSLRPSQQEVGDDILSEHDAVVDIPVKNGAVASKTQDCKDNNDVNQDHSTRDNSRQDDNRVVQRNVEAAPSTSNNSEGQCGETDESDSSVEEEEPKPIKPERPTIPFHGIMFKHDDPKVYRTEEGRKDFFHELMGGPKGNTPSGVFVRKADLLNARKSAKTAKQYARKLFVGVFTNEAMSQCTVSGDFYKAAGREKITQKPKLNDHAIGTIIDAALYRQSKKGWNPILDPQAVKGSLRQKLVELRVPRRSVAAKSVKEK